MRAAFALATDVIGCAGDPAVEAHLETVMANPEQCREFLAKPRPPGYYGMGATPWLWCDMPHHEMHSPAYLAAERAAAPQVSVGIGVVKPIR